MVLHGSSGLFIFGQDISITSMLFLSINNLLNIFGLKALWTFVPSHFLKLAIIDEQQDFMLSIAHVKDAHYKCFNLLDQQTGKAH